MVKAEVMSGRLVTDRATTSGSLIIKSVVLSRGLNNKGNYFKYMSVTLNFSCFQRFFFIFHIFHPNKYIFPCIIRGLFSIKQDIFLILKLLITFLEELVME